MPPGSESTVIVRLPLRFEFPSEDICQVSISPPGRAWLVLVSFLWLWTGALWGQPPFGGRFGAGRGWPAVELRGLSEAIEPVPQPAPRTAPTTVSAYVLRHPPTSKGKRLVKKALHLAELGDHFAAIQVLQEAIATEPSALPFADNLLGLEYLRVRKVSEALDPFEEAACLMPEVSANHSNLGISLALIGQMDSAKKEARKALELDRANSPAKVLLDLLSTWRSAHPQPPTPK